MSATFIPGEYFVEVDDAEFTISSDNGAAVGRVFTYDDFSCLEPSQEATVNAEALATAHLFSAAPNMLAAMDPDTLNAIADEIDCFKHSARAAGLRSLAKRQRAAIAKATAS